MKREALLIVDLQLGAFDGARAAPLRNDAALLERVRQLLAAARAAGAPVVFVQDCGRAGGAYEEGTPHWPIHPAIHPQEGEHVVRKRRPDAFEGTDLACLLASLEVGRVACCGQRSEGCLLQTCLGALDAGLDVVLISDAHSTQADEAAAIVAETNRILRARGARLQRAKEWKPEENGHMSTRRFRMDRLDHVHIHMPD